MATNPNKAFLTGADSVLSWFDTNAKKPYWSVTDAKNVVLFFYCEDDMHDSRAQLADNLYAAVSSGITATLTLRLHGKKPKEGYFMSKGLSDTAMMTTYFRPVEFEVLPYNPQQSYGANNALMDKIGALESKIAALQMSIAQEEEDEEEEDEEDNSLIGSIMGNPAVKQMLLNAVANLITPQPKPQVSQVAGIESVPNNVDMDEYTEQDEKIDEAIERLKIHDPVLGDDLLKLCAIAENDPAQFNMLLKMLRI